MRQIVLVILFPVLIMGQYRDIPEVVTKVATAAGGFLKLETSARAIGMGGSFVASGRGVSGIPYNPASIGFIEKNEAYFSQVNYLAGITHGVLTYGTRVTPSDYVGFHLFYLDSGPMEVTTELYPDGTNEDFRVVSIAARAAYARSLTDRLKVGGSINYIRDKIAETEMQTVSYDIGSNFQTGIYGTVLGMSITNFGPEVQYTGEDLSVQVAATIDVDGSLQRITDKFPLPLSSVRVVPSPSLKFQYPTKPNSFPFNSLFMLAWICSWVRATSQIPIPSILPSNQPPLAYTSVPTKVE